MARCEGIEVVSSNILLHVVTLRGRERLCKAVYWEKEGECLIVQVTSSRSDGQYWDSVGLDKAQTAYFEAALAMRQRSGMESSSAQGLVAK